MPVGGARTHFLKYEVKEILLTYQHVMSKHARKILVKSNYAHRKISVKKDFFFCGTSYILLNTEVPSASCEEFQEELHKSCQ